MPVLALLDLCAAYTIPGEKIKVATIGGSITAGQGAVDAPNWPQYLFNWLEDTFGADVVQGEHIVCMWERERRR